MSPPLGAQGNPIIIEDSDEEEDGQDDDFTQQNQPFQHQFFFYIVKNVKINNTNTSSALNTYVTIVTNEHQCTRCPIVQDVEAGEFNHSRGYCYKLFFSCSPCF